MNRNRKYTDFLDPSKYWIKNNAILVLVLMVLTILVGIVFSETQTKIGWLNLVLALLFIIILFIVLIILIQRPLLESLNKFIKNQTKLMESMAIPWLKDTDQLTEYELDSKDFKEIWLITLDLLDDVQDGPFQSVVEANLKKNIKYYYFVPENETIKARVKQIQKFHRYHENLNFIFLPNSFIFIVPKLDIVIYNPLESNSRAAFMGIPTPDDQNHYHALVNSEFIDKLVGILSEIPAYLNS